MSYPRVLLGRINKAIYLCPRAVTLVVSPASSRPCHLSPVLVVTSCFKPFCSTTEALQARRHLYQRFRAGGRHQFERTILRLRQVIYHLPALLAPKRCRNQEKVLARASGSTQSWTQRPSEIREGYQYQKTRSYTSAMRLQIPQQRQRT